jgi:hypothetical protein
MFWTDGGFDREQHCLLLMQHHCVSSVLICKGAQVQSTTLRIAAAVGLQKEGRKGTTFNIS